MATVKQAKAKLTRSYKNIESIKSRIADLEKELEELGDQLEEAEWKNQQAHKDLKAVRAEQDPEGMTFEVHGTKSDSCRIEFMSVSFETFSAACRAINKEELPSNMSPKELFKIPNSPKAGRKQNLASFINGAWRFSRIASNFLNKKRVSKSA